MTDRLCDPDIGCGQPMSDAEWSDRHETNNAPTHPQCCRCNIDRRPVVCAACDVTMSAPHGDHVCPHCAGPLTDAPPRPVVPVAAQGRLL
jgi:hypothetical protein